MSKIAAVVSQKGGVGKTTLALNVAYSLAARQWRVLLVDADFQGAIGWSLSGRASRSPGLLEVAMGHLGLKEARLKTRLETLDILPVGHPDLNTAETQESWFGALVEPSLWRSILSEAGEDYDLILIDTPSGLQGPTAGALFVADYLICPIQADPLCLRTLPALLQGVGRARELGSQVEIAAFVMNMVEIKDSHSLEVLLESWSLLPSERMVETHIPRDATLRAASAAGVPLGLLRNPPPPLAGTFDTLSHELALRMNLLRTVHDTPTPLLD